MSYMTQGWEHEFEEEIVSIYRLWTFLIEWVKNVAYVLNYGIGFTLILLGKLELVCDLAMKSNIMIVYGL